ncbi:hypothetical protein PQX77_019334, partial [Marasmius sp. AFHP31]
MLLAKVDVEDSGSNEYEDEGFVLAQTRNSRSLGMQYWLCKTVSARREDAIPTEAAGQATVLDYTESARQAAYVLPPGTIPKSTET